MIATVADIIKIMEKIAPPSIAEKWDNVGLQVGKFDWPVKTVLVSLDSSLSVVKEAASSGVDMLISHHPLIFNGLKRVDFATSNGEIIKISALNSLAVYAAHTNMDSVKGGLNDVLAEKLGIKNLKVLVKSPIEINGNNDFSNQENGLGRVGELEESVALDVFAKNIKEKLNMQYIKMAGKKGLMVKKVALCTGSGSSLINDFFKSEAQVYISGDMRYHDARDIEERGLGLLDIGHFSSEHLIVKCLSERLIREIKNTGFDVNIKKCQTEKDPYNYI
ncbi:MAG: Nif3-like dinuclear metal center hexameric protein [Desulfobacteraceae bacterium 4572_19]|nr:MAG: Nif3-like dinuclear metal center hexameric protein [Desulfobacteraceae bacterium 4572_19]